MPVLSPFGKVNCPHCFSRFHLSLAPRRFVSRGAPTEPCGLVGKHFGLSPLPVLPKIDRSHISSSFWKRLGRRFYTSPDPNNLRSICPECGIFLPDKIASGELSSEVFAIVGARSSGKSNYFGVLLHELRKKYGGSVGFEMVDAMTYTPSRGAISSSVLYRERYGDLYDTLDPKAVGQTNSVQTTFGTDRDPRIPLIYQLKFKKRSWQHFTKPLSHRVPVYLLVFDAAGEDMDDQTVMEQYYSFLECATGIVFLIDPFEYPGIRRHLPVETQRKLPAVKVDPGLLVDKVLNVIRKRKRWSESRKISIPTAFVLTKSDLFKEFTDFVHANAGIYREGQHQNGYDIQGGEDLSQEVRQYITNWDSAELVNKAQWNFTTHSFFAVSALGAPPDQRTLKLQHLPEPHRVADPLLWLFWQRGYIPSIRRV